MASRRIYSYDEGMPYAYVDVWALDRPDRFAISVHDRFGRGSLEGSREAILKALAAVTAAVQGDGGLQPHPDAPRDPAPTPPAPVLDQCSRCKQPRTENGVCHNPACPDPSYNLRVEVAKEFLRDMQRLGVRGATFNALEDLMARKFVNRGT